MNIFGFTITRTSKKLKEKRDLEIFERCVDALDKGTTVAKHIAQSEPTVYTLQELANVQEHLETLIDIYDRNPYSRPASMFKLTNLISDMRKVYANYATASSQLSQVLSEIERLKNVEQYNDPEYDMFGEAFKKHLKTATEQTYRTCIDNINLAIKEYVISLNAIRYTITHDITRIATGVDIIKQYHETKGYTVPEKGLEFTVRFKKLSRDEVSEQVKSNKEGEDNESKRNGI